MITSSMQLTTLEYLNNIIKMGYVNISIAAVIVSTINKCLIYAHMSSTAETAWASLGHSNQDTNQHI